MKSEIIINSKNTTIRSLKNFFDDEFSLSDEFTIELRNSAYKLRGIDPTILVAIVGTSGTAIGAFIGGLLKIIEKTKEKKIVLVGRSGRKVEITGNTTPKQLKEYVKIAKELDIERIDFEG